MITYGTQFSTFDAFLQPFSQSGEIWIKYTLFSCFLKEIIIHQELTEVNIPLTGCFLFHA